MRERRRDLFSTLLALGLILIPMIWSRLDRRAEVYPCRAASLGEIQIERHSSRTSAGLVLPRSVRCDGRGERLRGGAALLFGQAIDLNSAPARELRALPGISRRMARRIEEDRRDRGPYIDLDALTRVRGIGERSVERLRGLAVAGPVERPRRADSFENPGK